MYLVLQVSVIRLSVEGKAYACVSMCVWGGGASVLPKNILKTKVDKIYKLNEYVDAYKYSQSQRTQGKLVIKVS